MKLTPVREAVGDLQKAIETNRLGRIGGSDAGTILGLNRWKSAYTLWAEMCGMVEPSRPSPDNERIRLGHDLEDYAAKRWMEFTGKKCKRENVEFSLKEYPFMVGHIDRRVVGERAGLEIKTTGENNKTDFAGGDIEPQWYAQCLFYMAVTGMPKWYLAVLQFGKGFYCFEIQRNEEEIEQLVNAICEFWKHVRRRTAPVIDGSESTSDTIDEMWSGETYDDIADLDCIDNLLEERARIVESEASLKEQKQLIDNRIKDLMGDMQTGRALRWRVTWKPQTATRLDTAKLKAEKPEIYEQYSKTTESRVFKVTEVKERKSKE